LGVFCEKWGVGRGNDFHHDPAEVHCRTSSRGRALQNRFPRKSIAEQVPAGDHRGTGANKDQQKNDGTENGIIPAKKRDYMAIFLQAL
jgi:hypothetical protein